MFTRRFGMIAFAALAGAATATAAAQVRRTPGEGPAQVQVGVELKVGADSLQAAGAGTCTHAPQASIYNVRSQLRTARYASGGQSVQLTMWDPLDGSEDMFTLAASKGSNSRTVSTVRGGQATGSGKVTFEPSGKGGTFRVDAKAADGSSITGTIRCDAFTPHVAEGG
jgi:hypothetical protein